LLIGHNPELESLLVFLNKGRLLSPDDGKLLPTATLAIFAMPDNWNALSKGCGKLLSITRPKDLTSFRKNSDSPHFLLRISSG
jgi:phosphohistidine phosphatase